MSLSSLLLSTALVTGAVKVTCVPSDASQCAARLDAGDAAPFDGVLLSDNLAAADLAARDRERKEALALVQKLERDANIAVQEVTDRAAERERQLQAQIAARDAEIERLQPAFYEHPLFIAGVIIVCEVAVVAAVAGLAGAL